ncbi:MAG TPA: 2-dehydropantoate 2-reductase [Beijerinckiaceae bacterium]|nr:2-dehydropantoate 2-reductase [Beijerinckiaceae bacterium]HVB89667.1 2-dehydropantoate 2-reductase [Beijerinckiaceae bacterium]
MRILVVGAGAVGGYFGGRLLEAGRDVTFLVRVRRAAELARTGLVVESRAGSFHHPAPPLVDAQALKPDFDLVLLSCKAYDLEGAIDAFAPAVGSRTAILPLLNGMRHLDALSERFGAAAVLGGKCFISTVLDPDGRVLHLSDAHGLTFGERDGTRSPRVLAIEAAFANARFESGLSTTILQDMWEKWSFIATAAGITCLMRAALGDIVATGAGDLTLALFDECRAIARDNGFEPRRDFVEGARATLVEKGSTMTASMLRDVESGARTECDQILGDLLRRARGSVDPRSILRLAYAHAKAYEARRERELGAARG